MECCDHSGAFISDWMSSFLQITRTSIKSIKSWMVLKFHKIGSGTAELAALDHPENSHRLINGEIV